VAAVNSDTNAIDPQGLRNSTFVKHVAHLDQVESTSDYALGLARQLSGEQLPALVVADLQTKGRGRGANRWWAAAGSLPFTLIVQPAVDRVAAVEPTCVSLAVGLAVARGLQGMLEPSRVRVKWPNDVYVDGRKICGILIEQPAARPVRWLIGIGLNVNNSLSDGPADLRERATSLTDVTGRCWPRQDVLQQLLWLLELQLRRLTTLIESDGQRTELVDDWRSLCLLTGKRIELDVYGERVQGCCEGIDAEGGLRLRTADGIRRFLGGIVTQVGE
jgi:BirA family biotin operon repressor/biotin-[acetyl-CoA-carboxylase] ligase